MNVPTPVPWPSLGRKRAATRRLLGLLGMTSAAVSACALRGTPPTPPAAAAQQPIASLQELMQAEVDAAADGVWGAVETVVTPTGTEERQPRTVQDWTTVRYAAITLVETANLLVMQGRRVGAREFPAEASGALDSRHIEALVAAQRPLFDGYAVALRRAGLRAIDAVDARDPVALLKAGGDLDEVCEGCHRTFWYPNQRIPALPDRRDDPAPPRPAAGLAR